MLKSLGAPVVAATVLCGLFSGSDARAEGNDRAAAQATYGVLITPRDPETSKGSNAASIAWQQDVRIKRTIHIDTGKDFFNAVRNLKGAGRKVDLLVINGEGTSNKPSLSFKPNPGDGDYLDPDTLEFAVRNPSFQGFMSKDGAVLLSACSTTCDEAHTQFTQDLGRALLGPDGGYIIGSKGWVASSPGDCMLWEGLLALSGKTCMQVPEYSNTGLPDPVKQFGNWDPIRIPPEQRTQREPGWRPPIGSLQRPPNTDPQRKSATGPSPPTTPQGQRPANPQQTGPTTRQPGQTTSQPGQSTPGSTTAALNPAQPGTAPAAPLTDVYTMCYKGPGQDALVCTTNQTPICEDGSVDDAFSKRAACKPFKSTSQTLVCTVPDWSTKRKPEECVPADCREPVAGERGMQCTPAPPPPTNAAPMRAMVLPMPPPVVARVPVPPVTQPHVNIYAPMPPRHAPQAHVNVYTPSPPRHTPQAHVNVYTPSPPRHTPQAHVNVYTPAPRHTPQPHVNVYTPAPRHTPQKHVNIYTPAPKKHVNIQTPQRHVNVHTPAIRTASRLTALNKPSIPARQNYRAKRH